MMERQMELFEDGGLKDEGGMTEPESGNPVPSGSSRKEVADDIPAMLSEGEFVFPADVTRYIGLDKLMNIRQDAKMGLAKMEEMGQMGEEREVSDDEELPFGMADLIVVSEGGEPLEMAEGGVASTRQLPISAVPTRPNQTTSYKKIMGQNKLIFKEYKNAAGESMTIAFLGNVPLYPIPEGYTYYDPASPDSHPSNTTGTTGTTVTPTDTPILVQETPDYGGEVDTFGRPVGSVHTAPDYTTMGNDEFTSAMTTKHTNGSKGTKIALGLISIVAPPLGIIATAAHYSEVQNHISIMESKVASGTLSAAQVAEINIAIASAKETINTRGAKIMLSVTNSIAKALGIKPAEITTINNTVKTTEDVISETAINSDTKQFVSQVTDKVNAKLGNVTPMSQKQQAKVAPSFTKKGKTPATPQQISNQQMITPNFTPQQISNQQMTTGQTLTPASLSNNVVDNTKSSSVANAIAQKSMPTVEFNPVTGQLESTASFTPVNDPALNQFQTDKQNLSPFVPEAKVKGINTMSAISKPVDSISPTLGMPMDSPIMDMANINLATKDLKSLGTPMNPAGLTDDYGNTFGKGMANNVTSDFSGAKSLDSQIDMMDLGYGTPVDSPFSVGFGGGYTPKGISDPSQVPTYDSQTPQGIQDPSEIVQDTSLLNDAYSAYNPYGTTATTSTKQTADSFIDAPTTDSIVSKDNQAFYDAQQQKQDSFLGTPGVGKPGEVNPYGTATAAKTNYDIGIGDTGIASSSTSVPKTFALPKGVEDFRNLKAPETKTVTPVEKAIKAPVVTYKPESIVPGAYTGSGMNNTISVGGKIAGVTGVEGVVPDSKNPNEVSKVSKTSSSGNTTQHTVFSNTQGQLYAKNPFGTTFSVTKNSDGTFTAGSKTPKGMLTDAQPASIFSGLLSGGTKSTPTVDNPGGSDVSPSDNFSASSNQQSFDSQAADAMGGSYSGTGGSDASPSSSSSAADPAADGGRDAAEADHDGGDGDGKIVCTEMYRQTRLEDWKNDMKIWGLHTTTHLTPYHQNGYHVLFKPWVRGMRKYKWLMLSGGWLAKRRTQHLKHVLSNSGYFKFGININEKDDIVGNIWCKVWHPVSYIVGKLKSIIMGKK